MRVVVGGDTSPCLGGDNLTAPILAAVLLGDRSHEVLDGWRAWLNLNNAAVMSVLFLIFGVVLIGQGIQAV